MEQLTNINNAFRNYAEAVNTGKGISKARAILTKQLNQTSMDKVLSYTKNILDYLEPNESNFKQLGELKKNIDILTNKEMEAQKRGQSILSSTNKISKIFNRLFNYKEMNNSKNFLLDKLKFIKNELDYMSKETTEYEYFVTKQGHTSEKFLSGKERLKELTSQSAETKLGKSFVDYSKDPDFLNLIKKNENKFSLSTTRESQANALHELLLKVLKNYCEKTGTKETEITADEAAQLMTIILMELPIDFSLVTYSSQLLTSPKGLSMASTITNLMAAISLISEYSPKNTT